jgi:ATP-dependent exoDNAse (exonuclease V) beta subunit
VLVQAPAGSGKTTLLAQRYLRLLRRVESPERILALTFTRRAAQEMRERILHALAAGAQSVCPPDLHPDTWALAAEARRHLERCGVDLERYPARVRIETIDAFNAWLAAQLPVTAGSGAVRELREDAGVLHREAARRALAQGAEVGEDSAVERVLALDDQRWGQLVDLIAHMLPSRDRWLPLLAGRFGVRRLSQEQLEVVRQHFDQDLSLLISRVLSEVQETIGAERLESVVPVLVAAARDSEVAELEPFVRNAGVLSARTEELGRWQALAQIALKKDGQVRGRVDKNLGFRPQSAAKAAMQDWLAELARQAGAGRALKKVRELPAPVYSDAEWARVRDVAELLVLAAATLEQVFAEQGASDFSAVSIAALRALGGTDAPTDLALKLDYTLEHILVDEFQDTSSAQLRLLELLTAGWQRGDGRSVFCVGDPMQSIYGFRQAEVRAFLELAEVGLGDLRFGVERLQSNFRAARDLVDWVNHTFAHIMPNRDDRARGAIAFRPSLAAREVTAPERAVLLRSFPSERAEAQAIAASIEARRRRFPHWRIAVLVRARAHARAIAHALRARQVEFEALDVEPLIERPVVRDVLTLLRALVHPGDRIAWLGVLRSPAVGLALADLLVVAREGGMVFEALADEALLAQLSDEGRARCAKLRGVLEAAFVARGQQRLARWLESTWLALGGPACVDSVVDLEHVRLLLQRIDLMEERGLPDPAEIEESFADLCAESGAEPQDARSSGLDQSGAEQRVAACGRVEIMTIHKAKGLEFDCVFVPALSRHTRSNSNELLLAHEFARADRDGLVMAARPPVGAEVRKLFDFLREQMRESAALEAQRLLYVACTRAKRELHLTAMTEPEREEEEGEGGAEGAGAANGADRASTAGAAEPMRTPARRPFRPRRGSLLDILWPVLGAEFAQPVHDPLAVEANAPASIGPAASAMLARLPLDWSPPASRAEAGEPLPSALERQHTPVFDWVGETARRVGSLVHAELQRLDLATLQPDLIRAREPGYRRWLMLRGVPREHASAAADRVVAALLAVQTDERGRWILTRRPQHDYREQALSGPMGGETQRVVFDRCFIDEAGVRWVIDYKTSEHRGGGLEVFLDREVERYRPQLERYAQLARRLGPEPIRVGLYFPLMRAWREWEPG